MTDRPLRVMAIGAHPDDCEYHFGGTAALYLKAGHIVKFVSATNGNAGHQTLGRAELAAVRSRECAAVVKLTGVEYEILPNDDGGLTADLDTRAQVVGAIRRFRPDIVFTHRAYDYHADHRTTGLLVQDASFLLGVPAVCPEVPCLRYMPAILSFIDSFKRPCEFRADIAVDIGFAVDTKTRMLDCHRSQFYDWLPWVENDPDPVPEGDREKLEWLGKKVRARDAASAARCREQLAARYGEARASRVECAEAFEVSEYGAPIPEEKIPEYFPF
jgi:LmbE family N-acetylglucosaminyl deacetylase